MTNNGIFPRGHVARDSRPFFKREVNFYYLLMMDLKKDLDDLIG